MSDLTEISKLVLQKSGWFPERKVDITHWKEVLKKVEYPIFKSWSSILGKFGDLKIETAAFQDKPFLLSQQKAILMKRADPVFEFLPEKTDAIELSESIKWKSIQYLKNKNLEIAPLGTFQYIHPQIFNLFVLSDGTIYGGGSYSSENNKKDTVPGLFYLGDNIEGAINNTLEEFLGFL
jgi:hypothetical protein